MRAWVRATGWVTVLVLTALAGSCRAPELRTAGLDVIRERGVLRVVVRPGFMTDDGRPSRLEAQQASLLTQLAARLGVGLEWHRAARNDQVLRWLLQGRSDLAVARFTTSALPVEDVAPTTAVDWVDDLLVTAADSDVVQASAGDTVWLHRSALDPTVRGFLADHRLQVMPIPEEVTLEEVVRRVVLGRYRLAVVDSDLVRGTRWAGSIRILDTVAERRPVVWAVRRGNVRLRSAIDDFLFAEGVLARETRIADCRDLDQIRRRGTLRLVTRNSPTTCTVERGGLAGFEYELAQAFARQLGARLELALPPPGQDPLAWLEAGYGDLVALHEPVAPGTSDRFRVTTSYQQVSLVAVRRASADRPALIDELAGQDIVASRAVAGIVRLLPFNPALEVRVVPPTGDALAALLDVARGDGDVAVTDDDIAHLVLADRTDLEPAFVVIPRAELAWIVRWSSPRLARAADDFLAHARVSGLVRQLSLSELGSWQPHVPRRLPDIPAGALTPYDELLQWVGRRHGIDWRLLASLMYEESRFDPDAVGPAGSAGLFQFMPRTWRELGVEDPHHPAEAAEAGARYLAELMEDFADLALADRVAMAIAAYNVGPRHVFDARRLAVEMGLDGDRWAGNVETAMLLLDDSEVARRFPAGVCRCRRAVGYTRRILRRYRAYTEQFPPT